MKSDSKATASHPASPRVVALDAFRGATFAGMMIVNYPGDWNHFYAPLQHAPWHGWTLADLVFPFFLWIVGVAMAFSLTGRQERGVPRTDIHHHMVRRAVILFGMGLFLGGFPFGLIPGHPFSWATLRIPGVLQRIAVCYLLAGMILLHTRMRTQYVLVWVLLLLHSVLLLYLPVPGYGAGLLTPEGNMARYIDLTLLGKHTWLAAPVPGFDPEGILGTLSALATTLLGILTGHFLRSGRSAMATFLGLTAAGILLIALGSALSHWLPINKGLWTGSYAIFMAGMALTMFAVCHGLTDGLGWQRWAKPFVMYGTNPLALFFLAGLTGRLLALVKVTDTNGQVVSCKTFYYRHLFLPYFDPWLASFLHAAAFALFMYLVARMLHRQGWLLKI
ncbi:MAG: DUF5009 domain-containing protein [Magnetococcales bacterium]|nr:DUF5009 domain-containing protein [Magnetococcales bacterium]